MFDSDVELNDGVAVGNVGDDILTDGEPSGKPEFAGPRHHTQLSNAFELSARSLNFDAAPIREPKRQNHHQIPAIRRRHGVYSLSSP